MSVGERKTHHENWYTRVANTKYLAALMIYAGFLKKFMSSKIFIYLSLKVLSNCLNGLIKFSFCAHAFRCKMWHLILR